jgi:hypothetical protein
MNKQGKPSPPTDLIAFVNKNQMETLVLIEETRKSQLFLVRILTSVSVLIVGSIILGSTLN